MPLHCEGLSSRQSEAKLQSVQVTTAEHAAGTCRYPYYSSGLNCASSAAAASCIWRLMSSQRLQ